MYQRRIRKRRTVRVDAGGTSYFSSLRKFHGKRGIAQERLKDGSWLVKIGDEKVILPLRVLRPI